jgi:uncharacterized glyoxalase superfamily protein PhnB
MTEDFTREELREALPPIETFYSVFHAAVTDKFGVNRNVVAEEAPKREVTP